LVKEFKKEYGQYEKEIRQQETKKEQEVFSRELPGRYTTKMLYR